MMWSLADTIVAIASPPGSAPRGILRLSGPGTTRVLQEAGIRAGFELSPTRARRLPAACPVADGRLTLDGQLLLWPEGRSYTGELLAELHLPGSPPLLNEILTRLCLQGARIAQPGEFTLRAFLAGRIDLVQAEAVLGVIDSRDPEELKAALTQLAGGISTPLAQTREALLLHLADLEAGLDFVEEDIEFVQRPELLRRLTDARLLLQRLLEQSASRGQSDERPRVVLAGLPNAGKSTLLNRLARRDAALVSPVAGTTRDYLSATVSCQGVEWTLVDTAGWEPPRNAIESDAADLRRDQLTSARLIVWCTECGASPEIQEENRRRLTECRMLGSPVLEIFTKGDLSEEVLPNGLAVEAADGLTVSARNDQGFDRLEEVIQSRLSTSGAGSGMIAATAARCHESLQQALTGIDRALSLADAGGGDELIALELREVLEHMGRIAGRIDTDDILDRIFSRFCIGK